MLRRNTVFRASSLCGALHPTRPSRYLWGVKDENMHRLARDRPWWEKGAVLLGMVVFVNAVSGALYLGNRWYQTWRPSGNLTKMVDRIDEKLFSRPDLAVVAVKMVLYYALSGTTSPFGDPMIAPELYRTEAEELLEVIVDLHDLMPSYSIPDLWAVLTAKALARLGGPDISVRVGRDEVKENASVADMLQFPTTLIPEDRRDILAMKRVLTREGFSLEHIVAILGCYRNIGYHDAANFHSAKSTKPVIKGSSSMIGPQRGDLDAPDLLEKSTLDPFVFGGEYFDLLLDYKWKPEGVLKKTDYYRCSAKDRRREVVLLNPFSEQAMEATKRRLKAEKLATEKVEEASQSMQSAKEKKTGSAFGRTGEAQFIRNKGDDIETIQQSEKEIAEKVSAQYELEDAGEVLDPCEHVSMRGIDVMLLDDALTIGWLHRFSDNEVLFYGAVAEVFAKIQDHGHNANQLYYDTRAV